MSPTELWLLREDRCIPWSVFFLSLFLSFLTILPRHDQYVNLLG